MNYRFLCIVLGSFISVACLGYVVTNYEVRESSVLTQQVSVDLKSAFTPAMRQVDLFYYRPLDDMNLSGELQCSENGLRSVSYSIPVSKTPVMDTLSVLLKRDIAKVDMQDGFISDLPLDGLVLIGVYVEEGQATIALDDRGNLISANTCQSSVLRAQITKTLEQFPSVNRVRFIPEDLFGA